MPSPARSGSAASGCCRWRAAISRPSAGTTASRVPHTPLAQQAPDSCDSCGFLISLAGPLSDTFGVCGNGMANDDGKVVAFTHGCGAHSGARLSRSAAPQQLPPHVFDTVNIDEVDSF